MARQAGNPDGTFSTPEGDRKRCSCAAGPWRSEKFGKPFAPGRYLVEYRQGSVEKVFVMDLDYDDELNLQWNAHGSDVEVLRWARICSPLT